MNIKSCPFCGGISVVCMDGTIFRGQVYSDRYPKNVAKQDHGYQIRCGKCGCQTCWWHYKKEAINIWNTRN